VTDLTVLVVVRHSEARDLIADMVKWIGRRPVVAASDVQAIGVASGTHVDLALIEIEPGLDGRIVAERLREARPGLPVIYLTPAYDNPELVDLTGETVLTEPFSPDELERAMDVVLAETL
jgi:CheY-like chemotaxis protein